MKKETLFTRIIEAVKATGAEARQTATGAGLYHDGEQHGEIIDFVFISVSRYTAGHYNSDAARIAKEARKAAGRFRGVTIKEVQHQSYYIYQVYTTPDAERAEALTAKAAIMYREAEHEHNQEGRSQPDEDHNQNNHNCILYPVFVHGRGNADSPRSDHPQRRQKRPQRTQGKEGTEGRQTGRQGQQNSRQGIRPRDIRPRV